MGTNGGHSIAVINMFCFSGGALTVVLGCISTPPFLSGGTVGHSRSIISLNCVFHRFNLRWIDLYGTRNAKSGILQ